MEDELIERTETDVLDTPAAGGLVIRGGVLRLAGYAAGVGLSVAAAAVLIRELGATDYGRYVTVISLVTVVGALAEAGMTNLGIREYSTLQAEARDRLMKALLGLRVVISLLGVVVAVVFAVAAGYTSAMVLGTMCAGLGLVLQNVQGAVSVPLGSRLALGRVTVLDLVRNGMQLLLTIGLVLAGAGLVAYLAIPIPVGIVVLGLTVAWVRGAIPLRPSFDADAWGRLLRHTASFAAATAVGTIYVYVIVIVMSLVSNDNEVGYFGAAFRVFIVLGSIAGLVVSSALPVMARAARDDHERLSYALQRLFDVSVLAGGFVALTTVLGAEVAIDVVAGPGFEPAVGTLQIQGAAVFASFLLATWGFGLVSLHRHRELLLANGIALALSITFALILVPPHGAHGAAITTVIGEAGLAIAYYVLLVRGHADLRPGLRVPARVLPAAALAVGIVLALGLGPLAAALVAGAVFLAATAALGAIPQELIDAARGR
jgi:O-antigen/teichoic acid export membrane protein